MSDVLPCGTFAAYKRHLKRGEKACEKCCEAARVDYRRRYRLNGAGKHKPRPPKAVVFKSCVQCSEVFEVGQHSQRFCSPTCRRRHNRQAGPTRIGVVARPRDPETNEPFIGPSRKMLIRAWPAKLGRPYIPCPWDCGRGLTGTPDDPQRWHCNKCHLDVEILDGDPS